MINLTINCDVRAYNSGRTEYVQLYFTRDLTYGGLFPSEHFLITQATLSESRLRTALHRATLSRSTGEELDVVIKIDLHSPNAQSLRREAAAYHQAQEMQGNGIPNFYGFYEGDFREDRVTFLIIDYCGEPLQYFGTTPRRLR